MRSRALTFACAVLLGTSAWAQQRDLPLANEALLHSARAWEARDRGDLARLALEKLVAARPNSPEALLELGELQLRMGEFAAADRTLRSLRERFPKDLTTQTLETALRFATRDRLNLASVQRLVQIKRFSDAKKSLNDLFPAGPPTGSLALEYYRLLGSIPGEWDNARAGLERLATARPTDPRYQLALALHLADRDHSAAIAATLAQQLIGRDDIKQSQVDDVLRRAVQRADGHVSAEAMRAYAERHPDDEQILAAARQREFEAEQAHLLQTNALATVRPDYQEAHVQELLSRVGSDSHAHARHAEDLTRTLQGEMLNVTSSDARLSIPQLHLRARNAVAAGKLELATVQLEAALALSSERAEDLIALAERVEALDANEAGFLLAIATAIDPSSNWIFETYTRWLIDHDRTADAIARISTRPISETWSSRSQHILLASALDARARFDVERGELTSARSDLEQALALAPEEIWVRYRLATLLQQLGHGDQSTALIEDGLRLTPTNEMRYAAALHYSGLDQPRKALDLVNDIPVDERTDGMSRVYLSARVAIARAEAVVLVARGEHDSAAAKLAAFDPLVTTDLSVTRDLAYAWLAIGQPQQALTVIDSCSVTDAAEHIERLFVRADVLIAADDEVYLQQTIVQLRSYSLLTNQLERVIELERDVELRAVRRLQARGEYAEARAALNRMLGAEPNNRQVRALYAQVELSVGNAVAARDILATLVAEQPNDIDMRLEYVRALTDSGERSMARVHLQAVQERAAASDANLHMSIARRQLALRDYADAARTYDAVLAAEQGASIDMEARRAQRDIESRVQSWAESGYEATHKPGDSGVSDYEAGVLTNTLRHALDYNQSISLHADLTSIDAGDLTRDFDEAGLFGSVAALGDAGGLRRRGSPQEGFALGIRYEADELAIDVGTTPLGFLFTNVVGGVEWTPHWRSLDLEVGLERRAITSSVLSYAGMNDVGTGKDWGGVVEAGPYIGVARYEAHYSLAASLRYSQLSGAHVARNSFVGARAAGNWKAIEATSFDVFVGATTNYWSYDKNLQNYTLGSGGYYSPQSYLSIAIPLEIEGKYAGFSYRVRATLSHSSSKLERAPFYPLDGNLMSAASTRSLPAGYDQPYFEDDRGSGFSIGGYAAVERELTRNWVLGAKLDMDRADYYEPTTLMLYLRRGLGRIPTSAEVPPRPPRIYNED